MKAYNNESDHEFKVKKSMDENGIRGRIREELESDDDDDEDEEDEEEAGGSMGIDAIRDRLKNKKKKK